MHSGQNSHIDPKTFKTTTEINEAILEAGSANMS